MPKRDAIHAIELSHLKCIQYMWQRCNRMLIAVLMRCFAATSIFAYNPTQLWIFIIHLLFDKSRNFNVNHIFVCSLVVFLLHCRMLEPNKDGVGSVRQVRDACFDRLVDFNSNLHTCIDDDDTAAGCCYLLHMLQIRMRMRFLMCNMQIISDVCMPRHVLPNTYSVVSSAQFI